MSEPSITVTLEPLKALGLVSYLRLAPSSLGGAETGYVNLGALIKNTGTAALLVTKIELSVTGKVPGLDAAGFEEAAKEAKAGCPLSKALASVPEITLETHFES